jgi:hypothetical protein
MSLAALNQADWTTTPGPLEMLEDGQLEEDRPAWDQVALPRVARSLAGEANQAASDSRWAALLKRLRGYRRDAVLAAGESVWVPIVDVQAPPGGTAKFAYTHSATASYGLRLSLLGASFGSAASVTFRTSLAVPAAATGKSVQVRMLLTAIRYVSAGRPDLIRVDVRQPEGRSEWQVLNVAPPQLPDLSDLLRWRVMHRERLSGAQDSDQPTWSYSAGREARWEIGVGLKIEALASSLSLSVEATGADQTEVEFAMPYGRDYVFYAPAGANPLVPLCGVEH